METVESFVSLKYTIPIDYGTYSNKLAIIRTTKECLPILYFGLIGTAGNENLPTTASWSDRPDAITEQSTKAALIISVEEL